MMEASGLISENLAALRQKIDTDEVRLVAVTKTQPPSVLRDAAANGLTVMGENKVQEALEKAAQLQDLPIEWHLIGHLQTNKVRQAVKLFSLIHSVDSLKLAQEINRCAAILGKMQDVLLQVNVAGEETKSGVSPSDARNLANFINSLPNVRLCGVMTIAPFFPDNEMTRPIFAQTRNLFEELKENIGHAETFQWLSMGMTHDYEVAVEEGANMVRIGTGIFGERAVH